MRRATDEGGVLMEDVDKSFGALRVLDGVSLHAAPGEVVAVVGPSGCGKSTLLELACGLLPADNGAIRAAPAVLMPQRDSLLPWAGALDNAALPLRLKGQDRATARAGAPRRSRRSASPASRPPSHTSCPAGCASASRSFARCSPVSPCSASTSPSPRWTRSPARSCSPGSRRR